VSAPVSEFTETHLDTWVRVPHDAASLQHVLGHDVQGWTSHRYVRHGGSCGHGAKPEVLYAWVPGQNWTSTMAPDGCAVHTHCLARVSVCWPHVSVPHAPTFWQLGA